MTDYTSVRVVFNAMLNAEGFKKLWTVGQAPPASVVEWWGQRDWDIFSLLNGNEISSNVTKIIRSRYNDASCIGFLKSKLKDCYAFRLAKSKIPLESYHMQISDELVMEKRKEITKVDQANVVKAVGEEDEVAEVAVPAGEAEGDEVVFSQERQRIINEDQELAQREAELKIAREQRDERRRLERELRPQTEKLLLLHDPNSSALSDPAVATVVTKMSKERGLARETTFELGGGGLKRPASGRVTRKCPHCVRTFSDDSRLKAHMENHH